MSEKREVREKSQLTKDVEANKHHIMFSLPGESKFQAFSGAMHRDLPLAIVEAKAFLSRHPKARVWIATWEEVTL